MATQQGTAGHSTAQQTTAAHLNNARHSSEGKGAWGNPGKGCVIGAGGSNRGLGVAGAAEFSQTLFGHLLHYVAH